MPGRVINSTKAVEVIIQAVSAPLMVPTPTRPGCVSGIGIGAGAAAAATTDGAKTGTGQRRHQPLAHWSQAHSALLEQASAGAWAWPCWASRPIHIQTHIFNAINLLPCIRTSPYRYQITLVKNISRANLYFSVRIQSTALQKHRNHPDRQLSKRTPAGCDRLTFQGFPVGGISLMHCPSARAIFVALQTSLAARNARS